MMFRLSIQDGKPRPDFAHTDRLAERGPGKGAGLPPLHNVRAKGLGREARAYNGLVVAWPEIEKLAAQASTHRKTGLLL